MPFTNATIFFYEGTVKNVVKSQSISTQWSEQMVVSITETLETRDVQEVVEMQCSNQDGVLWAWLTNVNVSDKSQDQ